MVVSLDIIGWSITLPVLAIRLVCMPMLAWHMLHGYWLTLHLPMHPPAPAASTLSQIKHQRQTARDALLLAVASGEKPGRISSLQDELECLAGPGEAEPTDCYTRSPLHLASTPVTEWCAAELERQRLRLHAVVCTVPVRMRRLVPQQARAVPAIPGRADMPSHVCYAATAGARPRTPFAAHGRRQAAT